MNLTDIIRDPETLIAMQPEQLAPRLLPYIQEAIRLQHGRFNWSNVTSEATSSYGNRGNECALAISAALTCLHMLGVIMYDPSQHQWGWFTLSPRGSRMKAPEDFKHLAAVSLYPRGRLHPEIERHTFSDFIEGDYESAIFKAFKAVEARVRERAGYTDADFGVPMVAKAFKEESGPLTDLTEQTAEQMALRNLYQGAIGRFKNPSSHRFVEYSDPSVVVEMLSFASLLMRRLD